ncbi:MAG: DUF393 domain-containing protein [Flavobacteriales bacterium]|mgnify:FL=1|jgi:predicted DCC family thiol-disulfide oxidoreductase YuxK|nr:DUF393 domain-containing protein [Flavobacteriales bacterium]
MENNLPNIILFDGECNLCNRFVDFVIRYDRYDKFKFDSLQSQNSTTLLQESPIDPDKLDTVVLYSQNVFYTRSNAALLILFELGFPFSLTIILWIVPRFFRDWGYRVVAKNRSNWFGKRDTCRLPTKAERRKFL